jgi:hypothetical protein
MRNASVEGEHAPVAGEPVTALHILGRPGEQQLAEAQARHKHIGFVDLSALQVDPLECIAGIINFHPLAGSKIARRDRSLSILRELAIELFPEVMAWTPLLSTGIVCAKVEMLRDSTGRSVQDEHYDDRY